MYKYLFFDDQKLLLRDGLERVYGKPTLVKDSVYTDGHTSTDFPTSYIFKTDDGKYRLLYQGHDKDGKMHCYMAISDDGLHFEPADLSKILPLENRIADNEIMPVFGGEIGTIIEEREWREHRRRRLPRRPLRQVPFPCDSRQEYRIPFRQKEVLSRVRFRGRRL